MLGVGGGWSLSLVPWDWALDPQEPALPSDALSDQRSSSFSRPFSSLSSLVCDGLLWPSADASGN